MISKDELKAIGTRIRQIRKDLGLYQEELAKKLDVSTPTLGEAEKGKTKPGFDILFGLARIYDINLRYVLFGEGEVYNKSENSREDINLGDFTDEFKQMLSYMQRSKFFRAYVITQAKGYLIDNKESILKDIENSALWEDVSKEMAPRLTPMPNKEDENIKEKKT